MLRNLGLDLAVTANGPITMGGLFPVGVPYAVTIVTQPSTPAQICTVANGGGTMGTADVANVGVTCVTPVVTHGLDPSFGTDGKVTTGLPGGAIDLALQADGKLLLLANRAIARYDAAGRLDGSFGTGGTAAIPFVVGSAGEAQGVTVQPDGKIVIVGYARNGTQDDFAVARLDAAGGVDDSFGPGGKVTTDFSGNSDRAWDALVQPDGAIVVVGHAAMPSALGVGHDFAVERYTAAGQTDESFAGGKVTTNIAGRTDQAFAGVLQPDGGLVITGRVADRGGDDPDVALVRYGARGVLDGTFDGTGIVRRDLSGGSWDEGAALALQPDGKLVVAVRARVGTTFGFAVARFGGDGGPDGAFGTGGLATTTFSAMDDFPKGIALAAGGGIVVVGQSSNRMNPDLAVARFTAGGALDGLFDGDGKMTVDFFGSFDGAEAVAIQPDGKLVVAGFGRNGTGTGLGMVRIVP